MNDHIFDSDEKFQKFIDLIEDDKLKQYVNNSKERVSIAYFCVMKTQYLPYSVDMRYLDTLRRKYLVVPTIISDHNISHPIPINGDILFGFEVVSATPITRVEVVHCLQGCLWHTDVHNRNVLSLDESFDGLTFPSIAYHGHAFRILVFSTNGPIQNASVKIYWSFLDSLERRITNIYFGQFAESRGYWKPPPFASM